MERKNPDISKDYKSYSRPLYSYTWERLIRNKPALIGLILISIAILISFLGATIRPDKTLDTNEQFLSFAKKKPGFSATLLKVHKNKQFETSYFWEKLFYGGEENHYELIPIQGYHFKGTEIIVARYNNGHEGNKQGSYRIEDVIYPVNKSLYDPMVNDRIMGITGDSVQSFYTMDEELILQHVSQLRGQIIKENIVTKKFLLGTDQFGRDLMSRLMAGTMVSLSIGFISVFISLLIGITIGAVGGYFGGWVDDLVMWLINVVWSIPTLLLIIAITFVLGKGFWQIFIAVGLTMWVEVARVIRGQVKSIREKEFIEAGRALGFRNFRLITKHVIPNAMGPAIVISASNFAAAILIESGLSFLGLGLQPPVASWGRMIKTHYGFILTDGAYLAVLPGLAIVIMVLSFMVVGNGLRDALDTKTTLQTNV